MTIEEQFNEVISDFVGAQSVVKIADIQSLWNDYGVISRFGVVGGKVDSVVVKQVRLPEGNNHPRGWNSANSHQRKIMSYQVEIAWYQQYSSQCCAQSRVPKCYGAAMAPNQFLMVLEDLDAAGFSRRVNQPSLAEMESCLAWLAHFHARFMQQQPKDLWQIGTYWHLATRPDEWAALDDLALKNAAEKIDQRLNECGYQTLVHGDAKLANFCFSGSGAEVAAVDFQYVGGGCGMKDVAYFIGSCLDEDDCERYQDRLLDFYFVTLSHALSGQGQEQISADIERVWRPMFALAWTDFHRFIKGWSPGHWKIHGYSERLAQQVLADLNS